MDNFKDLTRMCVAHIDLIKDCSEEASGKLTESQTIAIRELRDTCSRALKISEAAKTLEKGFTGEDRWA